MDNESRSEEEVVNEIYNYAVHLIMNDNKSKSETESILVAQGLEPDAAKIVVENVSKQIDEATNKQAKKDMLHGALWCVGGTIGTLSGIGFIFWGAIIFGGLQFFKGLGNLKS